MRHTEWGDRHHSFGWLATEPRHLQPASDPLTARDEPADTSTIRDRARGPRPAAGATGPPHDCLVRRPRGRVRGCWSRPV